jgi:hypothetical protein
MYSSNSNSTLQTPSKPNTGNERPMGFTGGHSTRIIVI